MTVLCATCLTAMNKYACAIECPNCRGSVAATDLDTRDQDSYNELIRRRVIEALDTFDFERARLLLRGK